MALTQQINAVCELLSETKALPCETPFRVFIGLNQCSVPEFFGPFELMLNTDSVKHMQSDGAAVYNKRYLEKVKKITLMETNPPTC